MRKSLFSLLCLCAIAFSGAVAHAAQTADGYPAAPVSLVVVYTPGGATDLQARISCMVAQKKEYFGQPFVVLNKPGAGGQTGWNWMMERGSCDGLTITAYNMPHFIA